MATDLYALADSVSDENSFLQFLQALANDWEEEQSLEITNPSSPYSSGALGWENGSVGAVLDAAVSWGTASIDGLKHYEKPENPWRRAAHIIHAGKFYE
jgi:hypothetical protein